MGKKDDFQSDYFENKKRFADAFNGCLFGGKEFMKAEELEEADSVIIIPSLEEKSTKVICDKIRKWKGNYVSILTIESQSYIDYRMVLRVMKDDLANYEKQRKQAYQYALDSNIKLSNNEFLSRMPKDIKLIPVITLVIYLGTDDSWDGKTELYDLLDINQELKPYVSNYRFNLFDYHDHKDFSAFKTENKLLFELLSNSKDKTKMSQCLENSEYRYSKDPDVVTGILGCIGAKINLNELKNEKGEFDMMCKGLQDMIQDGILEGTISTLFKLVNNNIISLSVAAQQASVTEDRFMELVEQFHLNSN